MSLKNALDEQGFRGGTRSATEWNQWVQSEKEQLARVMERYYQVLDNNHRINQDNGRLHKENENLIKSNDRLREENADLREQNRDYSLLRKVFGRDQMDDLVRRGRHIRLRGRELVIVDGSGNMPLLIIERAFMLG